MWRTSRSHKGKDTFFPLKDTEMNTACDFSPEIFMVHLKQM